MKYEVTTKMGKAFGDALEKEHVLSKHGDDIAVLKCKRDADLMKAVLDVLDILKTIDLKTMLELLPRA